MTHFRGGLFVCFSLKRNALQMRRMPLCLSGVPNGTQDDQEVLTRVAVFKPIPFNSLKTTCEMRVL